jgi:hypothetical protein
MYVEGGNTGGGGGRRLPERRGTRLALELDRRLASDEPLDKVIGWWHDAWRSALHLFVMFAAASGNEALVAEFQPENFSDNEYAVFIVSMLSGCGVDDRATALHWFWPKVGLDAAKVTEPAYAQGAMGRFLDRLLAARAELKQQRPPLRD